MTHSVDKPDISNAEFDVLDALWEDSPATSADVIARLNKHKDWHEKNRKNLTGAASKKRGVTIRKAATSVLVLPSYCAG